MSLQLEEELERNTKDLEKKLLILENENSKIQTDYKSYRQDSEKQLALLEKKNKQFESEKEQFE